jgi:hypothetical protein
LVEIENAHSTVMMTRLFVIVLAPRVSLSSAKLNHMTRFALFLALSRGSPTPFRQSGNESFLFFVAADDATCKNR